MNSTILSFELGVHQGTAILATRSPKSALTDPGRFFDFVRLVIDYSQLMNELRICTKRGFFRLIEFKVLLAYVVKLIKLRFEHFR